MRMNQRSAFSTMQTRRNQHHYYSGTESDEDLVGNPPSVASSWASSIRGRPMTRGGRSNAPSRDYEDKEPSRCQEDRGKIHHSSSKPRKDFSGKPAIRKIQITAEEPSESEESPDEQHSQAEEGSGGDL